MALTRLQMTLLDSELTNDPLARGYSGIADPQAVADNLLEKNRTRIRESMSSSEVFQSVDKNEFLGLTDAQKTLIMQILAFGSISPSGKEADVFTSIFGAGSASISALASARQETISRAEELGISGVSAGDVLLARK